MNQMMHSGTVCLAMLALASTVAFAADQDTTSDDAVAVTESTPLSVPPLDVLEYPADRPSWVKNAPVLEGETHTWVVVTSPCDTPEDCDTELELFKRAAAASYIKQKMKSDHFDFYPVNTEWVDESLVTRQYSGSLMQGDTKMYEKAVELSFPPDVQAEINIAWRQSAVGERLTAVGGITFFSLTLLICSSMFLCMLSRRAERADRLELAVQNVQPASPVAFAAATNSHELPGQEWHSSTPETRSSKSSPLARLSNGSILKSGVLMPPIICTAIYLFTMPGDYFWPKWVWLGCVVIPVISNWLHGDSKTEK